MCKIAKVRQRGKESQREPKRAKERKEKKENEENEEKPHTASDDFENHIAPKDRAFGSIRSVTSGPSKCTVRINIVWERVESRDDL